jgi:hypothetical protein
MLKTQAFPSFLLIVMGSIDCLTTVIGVLYFGAAELNPFLAGIVSTNIQAFIAIKVAATIFTSLTYIQANKTLKTMNRNSKTFLYSHKLVKIAYAGMILFLITVVTNNLLILIT